jgi:hypothetical protein
MWRLPWVRGSAGTAVKTQFLIVEAVAMQKELQ